MFVCISFVAVIKIFYVWFVKNGCVCSVLDFMCGGHAFCVKKLNCFIILFK